MVHFEFLDKKFLKKGFLNWTSYCSSQIFKFTNLCSNICQWHCCPLPILIIVRDMIWQEMSAINVIQRCITKIRVSIVKWFKLYIILVLTYFELRLENFIVYNLYCKNYVLKKKQFVKPLTIVVIVQCLECWTVFVVFGCNRINVWVKWLLRNGGNVCIAVKTQSEGKVIPIGWWSFLFFIKGFTYMCDEISVSDKDFI